MAKLTDARVLTLKNHFNTGDQPSEANFADLIQWIQEGIEEHDHAGTGDGDGINNLVGPVGIGTLAPAYPFHVIKLIGDAAHAWIVVENDHNDYAAIFQARNNANKTMEVLIYGNTAPGAARYGVVRADHAFISATTTLAIGTSVAEGLVLGTNDVARITIAAAGAVKVTSLAGVGARAVVAAADGTLSAP